MEDAFGCYSGAFSEERDDAAGLQPGAAAPAPSMVPLHGPIQGNAQGAEPMSAAAHSVGENAGQSNAQPGAAGWYMPIHHQPPITGPLPPEVATMLGHETWPTMPPVSMEMPSSQAQQGWTWPFGTPHLGTDMNGEALPQAFAGERPGTGVRTAGSQNPAEVLGNEQQDAAGTGVQEEVFSPANMTREELEDVARRFNALSSTGPLRQPQMQSPLAQSIAEPRRSVR